MKIKWYLSTLVIVLVLLGICHNQISSPNQEILVQFNSTEVTTEQSQNAIALIKRQLQNFGIESFHIHEDENGELRISYHSSIDVESIKKSLFQEELGLGLTTLNQNEKSSKSPSKQKQKDYNLNVYELHKNPDSNNSAGKYVVIVKQDYDRFLNSNFYPSLIQIEVSQPNSADKQPNNVYENSSFAINDSSHIIPEVRAGPKTSKCS